MRITGMHFATTLALLAALSLAAGCDADRDTDAADDAAPAAALPDADAPVDLPPPVVEPGPTPGPGGDTDPPVDGDLAPDGSTPARFQGSYAADAAACDTTGHVSHLTIGSDTIAFHESSGPITEVAGGPSDITITAELTGEGETREATYRFRLSDDGNTLTDLGGGMERVRCD